MLASTATSSTSARARPLLPPSPSREKRWGVRSVGRMWGPLQGHVTWNCSNGWRASILRNHHVKIFQSPQKNLRNSKVFSLSTKKTVGIPRFFPIHQQKP